MQLIQLEQFVKSFPTVKRILAFQIGINNELMQAKCYIKPRETYSFLPNSSNSVFANKNSGFRMSAHRAEGVKWAK